MNGWAQSDAVVGPVARIAPLFVAHAIGTANITLVVALSPSIEESLGLGHAGFGLMVSAYYGATLALALPAGWLTDRFGLRAMLISASLLLAIGLLVLASAGGLATAALGLALAVAAMRSSIPRPREASSCGSRAKRAPPPWA